MITLRPAQHDDAADIADIHISSRREALPYLPELHTYEETLQWIADVVLPHQEVWVAIMADTVTGYVTLSGEDLNDLYVHPDYQGHGTGSALLDKAKELSFGKLQLWTFQRNHAARNFYERRGFMAVEFTDGRDNEEREPDVRYEWALTGSEGA